MRKLFGDKKNTGAMSKPAQAAGVRKPRLKTLAQGLRQALAGNDLPQAARLQFDSF